MKRKFKKTEMEMSDSGAAGDAAQADNNADGRDNAGQDSADTDKNGVSREGAGSGGNNGAANDGAGEKNANAERGAGVETAGKDNCKSGDAAENADEPGILAAELAKKLSETEKQSKEYLERWQRSAAEFDNYKRRTQNEMERMYTSSAADVIAVFLPVVDSIERAVDIGREQPVGGETAGNGGCSDKPDPFREGLILIEKQIKDTLRKLDIKPLPGVGEQFDPNLHEAVMHIDDGAFGQNVVAEVFRQGYIYKNKVVRHSVVKVAN